MLFLGGMEHWNVGIGMERMKPLILFEGNGRAKSVRVWLLGREGLCETG